MAMKMPSLLEQLQDLKLDVNQYDDKYFPEHGEVKVISRQKWSTVAPAGPSPSWVGFGDTIHKPYYIEQVPQSYDPSLDSRLFSGVQILKILRIINPYLEKSYELKKAQKAKDGLVRELVMYHATKPENVNSICTNNFNWRLHGTSRGHKHGQGVSFSPYPGFAKNFCITESLKVIIVTKILYINGHVGYPQHTLPTLGFDTTRSRNGNVFVKFEDNEFLPKFVVYY